MGNEDQAIEKEKIRSAYDAVIIGAGPAGMFAAYELAAGRLKILVIDMGRDIDKRLCPMKPRVTACTVSRAKSCAGLELRDVFGRDTKPAARYWRRPCSPDRRPDRSLGAGGQGR